LKSAWKLHLPPAPLATPKHEHKHVDEMPLLNASDSRTLSIVSCSSFRSGGKSNGRQASISELCRKQREISRTMP
jgi:hypothetical protein